MLRSPGGAVKRLGQHRKVAVVVDRDRKSDPFADQITDWQILEVEIHSADRMSGLVIQGCRDADSHRRGRRMCRMGFADLLCEQVHDLLLRITFGRDLFLPEGFRPPIDNADGKLCPAKISPDRFNLHHQPPNLDLHAFLR